jgi:non-canonical (house-cleaning) NTP pyrophosphatase
MPIVMYNGVAYTPRQILEEVERGTQLGTVLQQMVESGTPVLGQNPTLSQRELEELAKMRLRQLLSRPTAALFAVLSNTGTGVTERIYTPQQILEEIEKGTPFGKQWIKAEENIIRRFLTLR